MYIHIVCIYIYLYKIMVQFCYYFFFSINFFKLWVLFLGERILFENTEKKNLNALYLNYDN